MGLDNRQAVVGRHNLDQCALEARVCGQELLGLAEQQDRPQKLGVAGGQLDQTRAPRLALQLVEVDHEERQTKAARKSARQSGLARPTRPGDEQRPVALPQLEGGRPVVKPVDELVYLSARLFRQDDVK